MIRPRAISGFSFLRKMRSSPAVTEKAHHIFGWLEWSGVIWRNQNGEPMKLAIVTDTFPPDVNGVAMTLERFAAGLIGRGHAVEVIHPGVSGLNGEDRQGGFTEVCVPGFTVPRYAFVKLGWPRPFFSTAVGGNNVLT